MQNIPGPIMPRCERFIGRYQSSDVAEYPTVISVENVFAWEQDDGWLISLDVWNSPI
tara:strand:+ start:471 stop:641 length:171 start_codon:yes stop_codon:yes gene_type:complete